MEDFEKGMIFVLTNLENLMQTSPKYRLAEYLKMMIDNAKTKYSEEDWWQGKIWNAECLQHKLNLIKRD